MGNESPTPRQHLAHAISAALGAGATGETLVQLVTRSAWRARTESDLDHEYLDGPLDSGRHVPIEIRHARAGRTVQI